MESTVPANGPWHPLTFSSVAALAQTPFSRWGLLAVLVALVGTASMLWLVLIGWYPILQEATHELPEECQIRQGTLAWNGLTPVVLGRNSFLALVVDLDNRLLPGSEADILCEFGRTEVRIHSLFGYVAVSYPQPWFIRLDRTQVQSWWGAWEPFLWVALGLVIICGWLFFWVVCATLYAVPLRFWTFFLDRQGGWLTCWRLGLASQLTGALALAVAIVLYGLHHLDLVGFLFAFGSHLVIQWVYLLGSLSVLPRLPHYRGRVKNPFRTSGKKS